jgi:molybdopterin-guanine dinucleotide biosynthesis protein
MLPKKQNLPSLLLIAGSKRNIGKTTLASSIIDLHSKVRDLTAIKISSHFHVNTQGLKLL